MKKIIKFFLLLFPLIIIGCSGKNNDTYSTSFYSDSFMNETLGKFIQSKGELYYNEDKGCILNSEIGARIDCSIPDKKVIVISAICTDSKNEIKIDGIKCGTQIPFNKQSDYLKLCNEANFDSGYFLQKKNGFLYLDKNDIIKSITLTLDSKYLKEEGEDSYSTEKCTDIPKNRLEDKKIKEAVNTQDKEILKISLDLINPYSECAVINNINSRISDNFQDKNLSEKSQKIAFMWTTVAEKLGKEIGLNKNDIIELNKSNTSKLDDLAGINTPKKFLEIISLKMSACNKLWLENSELLNKIIQ